MWKGIIAIVALILGILIGVYLIPSGEIKFDTRIDSLYRVNDSLKKELSNIQIRLDSNNRKYEENCSIIINQSFDSDKEYFTKYLERFHFNPDSGTSKKN